MPATGVDDEYGAYFVLDLNQSPGEGACVNFIVHSGDNKALSENDLRMDLSRGAVVLTRHGLANLQYPQDNSGESPLPFTLTETQAAIFYHRPDGDYTGWGLHLWNGGSCTALADNAVNNITWDNPMAPSGIDSERGAYFILDLNQPGGCINFIVHSGDNKALGDADLVMDLTQGNIAFTEHGSSALVYAGDQGPSQVTLTGFAAHWVDESTLLWNAPENTAQVRLYADPDGDVEVADNQITGAASIALEAGSLEAASAEKFPHLASWQAWKINTQDIDTDAWLAGELVAAAFDENGALLKATHVQSAGALDAYYTSQARLGAWIENGRTEFAVWAPTARSMSLELYSDSAQEAASDSLAMTRDSQGVWRAQLSCRICTGTIIAIGLRCITT